MYTRSVSHTAPILQTPVPISPLPRILPECSHGPYQSPRAPPRMCHSTYHTNIVTECNQPFHVCLLGDILSSQGAGYPVSLSGTDIYVELKNNKHFKNQMKNTVTKHF